MFHKNCINKLLENKKKPKEIDIIRHFASLIIQNKYNSK